MELIVADIDLLFDALGLTSTDTFTNRSTD